MADTFAGIATGFSSVMGGPYSAGIVRNVTDAVFDDGGSIITPGVHVERACQIQVDAATEAMRQAEGFTDRDLRLLIISLTGTLNTDARAEVTNGPRAGLYRLLSCGPDPIGIGWECRARPV